MARIGQKDENLSYFSSQWPTFFCSSLQNAALKLIMQIFAGPSDIQWQLTLTFSTRLTARPKPVHDKLSTNIMKNTRIVFALLLLFFAVLLAPACSKKSGCPATESLKPKMDKKGSFKKSKGSSSDLFPKKMRKKMK